VVDALLLDPPANIIDLTGRLGAAVEALPGYQGAAW
jgi:GDP-mannose 6-dehydrogenase